MQAGAIFNYRREAYSIELTVTNNLSDELKEHIFEFLDLPSLSIASKTCREWHKLTGRSICNLLIMRPNSLDQFHALLKVALIQARKGDFNEAITTAQKMPDPDWIPIVLRKVATRRAMNGDFAGAKKMLLSLTKDDTYRFMAFNRIDEMQAQKNVPTQVEEMVLSNNESNQNYKTSL